MNYGDKIRKSLIKIYLEDLQNNNLNGYKNPPDYDLLVEPYWEYGYEYQTYIHHINENKFNYYEGFSDDCWEGFKKQPQYYNMTEEEIIEHFIKNRGINLGRDFGYKVVDYNYFLYDSGEYCDYIMVLNFEKI